LLYKITNREPRSTDAEEGVLALKSDEFDTHRDAIIGLHYPFQDQRAYGWYIRGIQKGLREGKSFITDPNIETLNLFHEYFGGNLHLLGLTADPDYLLSNLTERFTREKGTISQRDIIDIQSRLEAGIATNEKIRTAQREGLLHSVLSIGHENRESVIELVQHELLHDALHATVEGLPHNAEMQKALLSEQSFAFRYKERL
jgi:hypothetical protein